MISERKQTVVEAFFDAYNARDAETMDRLLHPDAKITTISSRRGMPDHWRQGSTRRYFEQLDEAWTNLRIEVQDYREVGDRILALGFLRGAGMASRIEVVSEFATVFVVSQSQVLVVDSYDTWQAGLDAIAR